MRMIELTEQQRVHNADNDDIHGSGGGTRRPTTRRRWSRIICAISAWKDLMATRRMRPRRMLCWTMSNRAEKLFLSAWAAASPDAGINAREEKTTSAAELQCFFADFSARAEALACPSSGAIESLYRS